MSYGDWDEIKKMIELLESSSLKKIQLKNGEKEILLEKESSFLIPSVNAPMAAQLTTKEQTPVIPPEDRKDLYFLTSPMVGTFFNSASPGQPNFINVGDTVDSQTIVCIIEAMKVMNEVKAGVHGVVEEVLVKNSQPVEFGTRLIRIKLL